jgi:hypothetical protein
LISTSHCSAPCANHGSVDWKVKIGSNSKVGAKLKVGNFAEYKLLLSSHELVLHRPTKIQITLKLRNANN